MLISALIAFGHFFAFFSLSAALVLELALICESPSVEAARRIRRADRAAGLFALMILVFGLLRVFYFGHGADFYFGNSFFWLKMSLFVGVALLSIYPTLCFMRWGKCLDRGEAPALSALSAKALRRVIHTELFGIGLILLCASLMARGIG